ncbi:GNAT family N-acetyltransferase [Saccharomonospora sp. NPDC046836]|uniref:GNAT family N-acetyltransferase n=1 Tax=Saccharomonospora sp. NPDC046836 TaxID=3156921 RepID=UPI0033DABC1A
MSIAAVRLATVDDAADIARIQADTWRTAYADIVGPAAIEGLDQAELERHWAGAIEHSGTDVHLATEGEFAVGFCVAGPAPAEEVAGADGTVPDDATSTGLIATVLVEPRWGRRGHGGRLLSAAASGLRARGCDRGITWVAQADSASLAFYRHAGWHPDNTVRTLDTGERTVLELRLRGGLELRLSD